MSTDTALISMILLKKLREEKLSSQEVQTLAEWQRRSPAHAAFIEKMTDEHQLEFKIKDLLEQEEEESWQRIEQKIDEQQGLFTVKKTAGWLKYAIAASLALLTGYAVYYFVNSNPLLPPSKPGVPATWADIKPGSSKAKLTLAGKLVFELDTVHYGKFAHQAGADIIKKDSGTVSYQIKGNPPEATPSMNTLATPRGGEFRLELPDGTIVHLNAASSIQYPSFFSPLERRVEITGEVYFEVASMPNKPFIVMVKTAAGSERAKVEVIGTHFNIKAYDEEKIISTTLVHGKVGVTPYRSISSTILQPGQQANLPAPGELAVVDADTAQVLSWKNGMFSFKSTSVQTVMNEISRWYGVDVIFDGPVSADRINGDASRAGSLEQLVNRIMALTNMSCTLENGKLVVRQGKNF
jgi:transmembrane sensor